MPGLPPITLATVDMTTMTEDEQDNQQGITFGEAAVRLLESGPNELP